MKFVLKTHTNFIRILYKIYTNFQAKKIRIKFVSQETQISYEFYTNFLYEFHTKSCYTNFIRIIYEYLSYLYVICMRYVCVSYEIRMRFI